MLDSITARRVCGRRSHANSSVCGHSIKQEIAGVEWVLGTWLTRDAGRGRCLHPDNVQVVQCATLIGRGTSLPLSFG